MRPSNLEILEKHYPEVQKLRKCGFGRGFIIGDLHRVMVEEFKPAYEMPDLSNEDDCINLVKNLYDQYELYLKKAKSKKQHG